MEHRNLVLTWLLLVVCMAVTGCREAEPISKTPLAISSPSGDLCTLDATVDISGTGKPGTTVALKRVEPVVGDEGDQETLGQASVSTGGTWQVTNVLLECGPNNLVAMEEGTERHSATLQVIRSPLPPGSHISSDSADFAAVESFDVRDKLVASYFYYWYDATNPDIGHMTQRIHHEPDESPDVFSWRNLDWHKRHLIDMLDARIDMGAFQISKKQHNAE